MHVIVCVDEKLGMAFNGRRLSQDKEVCRRIGELTAGKKLWMSPYSAKLFDGIADFLPMPFELEQSSHYLDLAGEGDYCFVELDKLLFYESQIESLVLFQWNRRYPSDLKLDLDLKKRRLVNSRDFSGNSHEKITEMQYVRF